MSGALDPAQFLGIEVDQVSRLLMLVADDGFCGFQLFEGDSPARLKTRPTVLLESLRYAAIRA